MCPAPRGIAHVHDEVVVAGDVEAVVEDADNSRYRLERSDQHEHHPREQDPTDPSGCLLRIAATLLPGVSGAPRFRHSVSFPGLTTRPCAATGVPGVVQNG